MPYIITRNWTQHTDIKTGTEFTPVLDKSTGHWAGHAFVSEEETEYWDTKPGFEVHNDLSCLERVPVAESPAVAVSTTGDPLADAGINAGKDVLNGAPPVPGSQKPADGKTAAEKASTKQTSE